MAMSRRLISATLLSLTLTMVHASAALAHDGPLLGGGAFFSADSVLLALSTSFLAGVICYALMVWDPTVPAHKPRSQYRELTKGE